MEFSYNECEIELPSGYVDNEGKLHKKVVVREMSGEEEELILNADAGKAGQVLNRILDRVAKLKDAPGVKFVDSLLMVDQLFLLVQARILSFGKDYTFGVECTACKQNSQIKLDLESLSFKSPKNPQIEEQVSLKKSGLVVHFKKNQGKDQPNLIKILEAKSSDKITQLLEYRITKILNKEGEQLDKAVVIKKLPVSDRKALREAMNESEGDAETIVDYDCVHCSHKMKVRLPIDENFFCLGQKQDS